MEKPTLRQKILQCHSCPLRETCTAPVPGEGRPERLFIVGEAPGREEDERGKPFIGRSGQLLRSMLAQADVEYYVTNVVKCRPPENRKPTGSEIQSCQPWLEMELENMKPKLLLLLGDTAARAFGLKSSMKILSRKGFFTVTYAGKSYPAYVTYHPAYVLRNPIAKDKVYGTIRAAAERLKSMSE